MPIDYKRYPPNWKKEIVPAIIARANNCCESCGVPNKSMQWRGVKTVEIISVHGRKRKGLSTKHYESRESAIADGCQDYSYDEYQYDGTVKHIGIGVYQTKIVLTIAHLDHDETNWSVSLERLAAYCQLCHLQYDAAEKYRRSLLKSPGNHAGA